MYFKESEYGVCFERTSEDICVPFNLCCLIKQAQKLTLGSTPLVALAICGTKTQEAWSRQYKPSSPNFQGEYFMHFSCYFFSLPWDFNGLKYAMYIELMIKWRGRNNLIEEAAGRDEGQVFQNVSSEYNLAWKVEVFLL